MKLNLKLKKSQIKYFPHFMKLKIEPGPFLTTARTPQTTFEETNLVHNYKCFQKKETALEIQGTK